MVADHSPDQEQKKSADLKPEDSRVPSWLAEGSAFLRTNRLEEAKEKFAQVLQVSPTDGQALNLLALCEFRLGNFSEAEIQFCRLIEDNPDDPSLRINLAMVYMKTRQIFKARDIFQEILRVNPDHPRLPTYMGLVEEEMGNFSQALYWYRLSGNEERVQAIQKVLARSDSSMPSQEEAAIAAVATPPTSTVQTSAAGVQAAALVAASAKSMREPGSPPSEGQAGEARTASLGYTLDVNQVQMRSQIGSPNHPNKDFQPLRPEDFSRSAHILKGEHLGYPNDNMQADQAPVPLESMKVDAVPTHQDGQKAPYRFRGALYVPISGLIYLRPHFLCQISGKLKYDAIRRRYRGKDTESFFAGAKTPLCAIKGEGVGIVNENSQTISLISIEHSDLYLLEQTVLGFFPGLDWENGRLPGKGKMDLDIVHLKGTGQILLATQRQLTRMQVSPESPVFVDPAFLVGWSGDVVPALSKVGSSEKATTKVPMVGFEGKGVVLGLTGI